MEDFDIKIGKPSYLSNLIIYPAFGDENSLALVTLEESHNRGGTRILETGVVEELEIDHSDGDLLFIHEGEEIIGARQNRIFATSMILPMGRKRVPVLCAEEGRWKGGQELAPSGYIAYPRVRSIISRTITIKKKPSQNEVWREIKRKQTTMRVSSKTRAMTESFSAKEEELSFYREYFPEREQIGFLAFTNLRFLGGELFFSTDFFQKFLNKLLVSYGLDALEDRMREGEKPQSRPEEVIEAVRKARLREAETYGVGEEMRGVTKKFVLRLLLLTGVIVHLSVLSR